MTKAPLSYTFNFNSNNAIMTYLEIGKRKDVEKLLIQNYLVKIH